MQHDQVSVDTSVMGRDGEVHKARDHLGHKNMTWCTVLY
jgi:hypothetical protein